MENLLEQVSQHLLSLMSLLQEKAVRQQCRNEYTPAPFQDLGLRLRRPCEPRTIKRLRGLGASPDMAKELAAVYCSGAVELAREYEDIYAGARTKFIRDGCTVERVERNLLKLKTHLKTSYRDTLSSRINEIRSRLTEHILCTEDFGDARRLPFKSEFLPLLEHTFAGNCCPTRAEKLSLARASGMTYRQVHTWFQNHRRRYKAKLSTQVDLPSKTHTSEARSFGREICDGYDSDATQCNTDSEASDSSQESVWSHASSFTAVEDTPFYSEIPDYAYPTTYPPLERVLSADLSQYRFPKPTWERLPASVSVVVDQTSDVLQVTERLKLLTLGSRDDPRQQVDVLSPFVVPLCPAPLPSLIRQLKRT